MKNQIGECDFLTPAKGQKYLFETGNDAPKERNTFMEKAYAEAQSRYSDLLSQEIETAIPDARILNHGWVIIVQLQNGSAFTLTPLSDSACDMGGTDCQQQRHEFNGIAWGEAISFLENVATLREETGTGAVSGFSPANAFAAPGQKSNRGTEQSKREGWTLMETESRFEHPFGESPLGQKEMQGNPDKKRNSEGRRKTETGHNYAGGSPLALSENSGSNSTGSLAENETADVFTQLAEKLPVDNFEIVDETTLVLTIDCVSIFVTSQDNNNFSTRVEIGGEIIQQSENLPLGDLTKWLFMVCDNVQSKVAEREAEETEMEVEPGDVWETIRELAKESGHSTDILRNKELFSLSQGLTVERPSLAHEQSQETTGSKSPAVKGSTQYQGHPVSLNESRDASKPYSDTLGGKVLRYVPGHGAVFVDKKDLPPQKKLNFDPVHGVILTEETVPTNRKGLFKFTGWK